MGDEALMIRIKLMGMLKDRTPPDGQLTLPDGATLAQALESLEIPVDSVQVFSVNAALERNKQRVLVDGDELTVLPPVGGG
jgi:sulfur carrier protein ThiS